MKTFRKAAALLVEDGETSAFTLRRAGIDGREVECGQHIGEMKKRQKMPIVRTFIRGVNLTFLLRQSAVQRYKKKSASRDIDADYFLNNVVFRLGESRSFTCYSGRKSRMFRRQRRRESL